ncbi:unnamed protein product [Arctogadus glacialis]
MDEDQANANVLTSVGLKRPAVNLPVTPDPQNLAGDEVIWAQFLRAHASRCDTEPIVVGDMRCLMEKL